MVRTVSGKVAKTLGEEHLASCHVSGCKGCTPSVSCNIMLLGRALRRLFRFERLENSKAKASEEMLYMRFDQEL